MNNDTISRQAAIEVLATMQGQCTTKTALIQNSKIWQQIKNLPSTERRGQWILKYGDGHVEKSITGGECSLCGFVAPATRYCPNCGAKMYMNKNE